MAYVVYLHIVYVDAFAIKPFQCGTFTVLTETTSWSISKNLNELSHTSLNITLNVPLIMRWNAAT